MATQLPHNLTMPPLSSLPSNAFRLRKITHYASDRTPMKPSQTRRINVNAPPNWYLLGQHSTFNFTLRAADGSNGTDPAGNVNASGAMPTKDPFIRKRTRFGAGAVFSKIKESLNTGSFCFDCLDDPLAIQPFYKARGFCSRRNSYLSDVRLEPYRSVTFANVSGTVDGSYGVGIVSSIPSQGTICISGLESAGYCSAGQRSALLPASGTIATSNGKYGQAYSVPASAYSRICQKDFVPVGLMGSYSTESFSFEFTMQSLANGLFVIPANGAGLGALGIAPADITDVSVHELRMNCSYIEVLDPEVQNEIEKLFKMEESIEMVNGMKIPLKLEFPIINYSFTPFTLEGGTSTKVVRIPTNSPSVRGILFFEVPSAGLTTEDGDILNSVVRFRSIKVSVAGHCIQECAYENSTAEGFPQLTSDLWTEYLNTSHMFSIFSPDREALNPDSPAGISLPQRYEDYSVIPYTLSLENSPHFNLNESELASARGVDCRNVGEIVLDLKYAPENTPPLSGAPLAANQSTRFVAVLAHDMVIALNRSGAHDITQSAL